MLRLSVRLVGFLLVALAFAALIVDGTRSVAAGTIALMPLGRTASTLFPAPFIAMHTVIESHVPLLWDPVLVTLLLLPAWLVIGGLGVLLIAAARPPRPKIGYARR